jgi:photosystem II stability/assembly factor-like uncharacterized protein
MKRISSSPFLCALLILSPGAYSQRWVQLNPLPTSNILRHISFVGPGTAVTVGDAGTVLFTRNWGENWSPRGFQSPSQVSSFTTVDSSVWWVVGWEGLIARTVDAGLHWKILMQDSQFPSLDDAYFADSQNGIVTGNIETVTRTYEGVTVYSLDPVLLRTSDGGTTWSKKISTNHNLTSLAFFDLSHGWGTGYEGSISRTSDGGKTWDPVTPFYPGESSHFSSIDSARAICWTSSWSGPRLRIVSTNDAGATWKPLIDTSLHASFVRAYSEVDIWAGDATRVYHTTNGGRTWSTAMMTDEGTIEDIAAMGNHAIAVGEFGQTWHTTNGGVSWVPTYSGAWNVLRAIAGSDSTLWAVGGGSVLNNHPMGTILLRSTDSGQTWIEQSSPTNRYCTSVAFDGGFNFWLGSDGGELFKLSSVDTAWQRQCFEGTGAIRRIVFLDRLHGWIVVNNGEIHRTTDGGNTWTPGELPYPGIVLNDLTMSDPLHGVAVGMNNGLFRTDDGGETWRHVGITVAYDYYGVCAPSVDRVIAVGSTGHILKSTDGGDHWYIFNLGESLLFRSVAFITSDTGFAVGDNGAMEITTNKGDYWLRQAAPVSSSLNHIERVSDSGLWSVGDNGVILRYANTMPNDPVVSVGRIPRSFSLILGQNYPNPFNPNTTIKYELAKSSLVRLSVYDILGREVSELVNEMKEAGVYEVSFDASGLSSGVYLYRLQTGNSVLVRKAVLLK